MNSVPVAATTLTRAVAACFATDDGVDVIALATATCRYTDVAADEFN